MQVLDPAAVVETLQQAGEADLLQALELVIGHLVHVPAELIGEDGGEAGHGLAAEAPGPGRQVHRPFVDGAADGRRKLAEQQALGGRLVLVGDAEDGVELDRAGGAAAQADGADHRRAALARRLKAHRLVVGNGELDRIDVSHGASPAAGSCSRKPSQAAGQRPTSM